MNVHAKIKASPSHRPQKPERRRFTADDLLAMETAGILDPQERVELIDGEIITMAAKSPRHEDVRTELADRFALQRPAGVKIAQEPAFKLSEYWEPEPDLLVFPGDLLVSGVRGEAALLVVEIAVTSLSTDLKVKAPMYAAHGVRECWVVDAVRLVTHVHRTPGPDGYASIEAIPAGQRIVPLLVPALGTTLADLGFEPLPGPDVTDGD